MKNTWIILNILCLSPLIIRKLELGSKRLIWTIWLFIINLCTIFLIQKTRFNFNLLYICTEVSLHLIDNKRLPSQNLALCRVCKNGGTFYLNLHTNVWCKMKKPIGVLSQMLLYRLLKYVLKVLFYIDKVIGQINLIPISYGTIC